MIETWGFHEDLKPIVLHQDDDDKEEDNNDKEDNNSKNKDNNNNIFKFLSFGT